MLPLPANGSPMTRSSRVALLQRTAVSDEPKLAPSVPPRIVTAGAAASPVAEPR